MLLKIGLLVEGNNVEMDLVTTVVCAKTKGLIKTKSIVELM